MKYTTSNYSWVLSRQFREALVRRHEWRPAAFHKNLFSTNDFCFFKLQQNEDARDFANVPRHQTNTELKCFPIEMGWFLRAYVYLFYGSPDLDLGAWKDDLGIIDNRGLLGGPHESEYKQDFVLVGGNAQAVLSQWYEFESGEEISFPVYRRSDLKLVVEFSPYEIARIPETGYFPYDDIIAAIVAAATKTYSPGKSLVSFSDDDSIFEGEDELVS